MKQELEDILQHHGVKGMKWGKRMKSAGSKAGGAAKSVATKATSKVKPHIDSIKRENSWNKQLKNAGNMNTKAIQKVAARAQLENDLKRLSKKSGIGSSKDKKDYLKRGNMSDKELTRKVTRLRAKDSLNRNASEATKKQREIAKKVLSVAAPLAITAVASGGKLTKKDLMNAAFNASGSGGQFVKAAMKATSKMKQSDELKDILLHSAIDGTDNMITQSLLDEVNVVEEVLQHYGKKGMKWGKHMSNLKAQGAARKERLKTEGQILKRRKQGEITRTQAKQERRAAFHKEQSVNPHYKKEYDRRKSKGQDDKKAMSGAYRVAQTRKKAQRAMVAKLAVGSVAAGKVGITVGKSLANSPDVQRAGKNIVQAMKNSPIRYVDGAKMKNVIN